MDAKELAKEFDGILSEKLKNNAHAESTIIVISVACFVALLAMLFIAIFPQYFIPTNFLVIMLVILNGIGVSFFLKNESKSNKEYLALVGFAWKAVIQINITEQQVFSGFSMTAPKEFNVNEVINADKTLDKP